MNTIYILKAEGKTDRAFINQDLAKIEGTLLGLEFNIQSIDLYDDEDVYACTSDEDHVNIENTDCNYKVTFDVEYDGDRHYTNEILLNGVDLDSFKLSKELKRDIVDTVGYKLDDIVERIIENSRYNDDDNYEEYRLNEDF